jgi:hypothetical protein
MAFHEFLSDDIKVVIFTFPRLLRNLDDDDDDDDLPDELYELYDYLYNSILDELVKLLAYLYHQMYPRNRVIIFCDIKDLYNDLP